MTSAHNISFSVSGTTPASISVALLFFHSLKKCKATDIDADVVPETEKEMLWADVKRHFTFPEDKEQLFKDWVMKKMAIAF